ncbi:uncharacterized protein LOC105642097 isoform X2 [Jatropha curcas]|uniref:uncharacterized protein LOC105642097 isoform X2 n=1 Tax=Jatropha curcas TaxID=180498 RepID=UPI001895EDAD|nr:uncharacterized protein LOC105642097 isoform X2 [Jatropha curcas]XP_037495978.1 uncharacterized protein LOC105642097 isoform X2 [Jatropha curcas]XP_037495980.1 uncharacterized protein LOC105642097 isoform X2 [Jatropha curcas]XP_037495981.1 uncharacterized protein LOC105642097 isoform X2 [Jatropha curcas]
MVESMNGFSRSDLEGSASGQSLDGSFRKSSSVISARSVSSITYCFKQVPLPTSLEGYSRQLKDYGKKLVNLELFKQSLEDWILENFHADSGN